MQLLNVILATQDFTYIVILVLLLAQFNTIAMWMFALLVIKIAILVKITQKMIVYHVFLQNICKIINVFLNAVLVIILQTKNVLAALLDYS